MQALRAAVQADKRAYVASTLQLTDAEAKSFWPIYDLYQHSCDLADRRRTRAIVEVVGRDRPLTDAYARSVATELIGADEAEIKARRTLQNRLMSALPRARRRNTCSSSRRSAPSKPTTSRSRCRSLK